MNYMIQRLSKISQFFLILVLMTGWIFSGWQPILQNPRISPKIQGVQAEMASILSPLSNPNVSYSRTPSGSNVTGAVSISVLVDSFNNFGLIDLRYWRVEFRNATGTTEGTGGNFYSEIVPTLELSREFVIPLPPGDYTDIVFLGCTAIENCNDNDADINMYLEYNGGNTIFIKK